MKIIKKYQGEVPDNKIMNTDSSSQTDTFSCNYMKNNFSGKNTITKNLLASPLQSNGNTGVSASLSDNRDNYDIIFVRVTANQSQTEAITIPFYIWNSTHGYGQIIRLNSFSPEGYYAYVYLELGTNYIGMRCPKIAGWSSNQIYVQAISGIKVGS